MEEICYHIRLLFETHFCRIERTNFGIVIRLRVPTKLFILQSFMLSIRSNLLKDPSVRNISSLSLIITFLLSGQHTNFKIFFQMTPRRFKLENEYFVRSNFLHIYFPDDPKEIQVQKSLQKVQDQC